VSSRLSIHQFRVDTHPRVEQGAALTPRNPGDYAPDVSDRDPRETESPYRLAAIGREEAEMSGWAGARPNRRGRAESPEPRGDRRSRWLGGDPARRGRHACPAADRLL